MRYILIAAMGFVGALARYALQLAFPGSDFPLGTFLVNIIGCFLLEITYNYLGRRMHLPKALVSGMGVGLLGAFTTLSAFTANTMTLMLDGAYLVAAANVTATLLGCFAATLAGHYVCRMLAARRMRMLLLQRAAKREDDAL